MYTNNSNINNQMHQVIEDLARQSENIILEQLNDLIKLDLLMIESTQPILIQDPLSHKIQIKQAVKLTYRDKEVIKRLTEENETLRSQLTAIQNAIKSVSL